MLFPVLGKQSLFLNRFTLRPQHPDSLEDVYLLVFCKMQQISCSHHNFSCYGGAWCAGTRMLCRLQLVTKDAAVSAVVLSGPHFACL